MLTIKSPTIPQTPSPIQTTSTAAKPVGAIDFSKPISDPTLALAAQQQAVAQLQPKTAAESAAKVTQLSALKSLPELEQRQVQVAQQLSVVTTAGVVARQYYNVAQPSLVDNIKNVCNTDNRDKLTAAIRYGIDMWRLQAHFQNLTIMGQTAIGNPGCLTGPDLKPWILQGPTIYSAQGTLQVVADAVATGVAENFAQYINAVTVPGLPWYPMFAAFAGPFAPPIPNIPMPLIVCVSQHFSKIASPSQLEWSIKARLPENYLIAEMDMFIYTLSAHLANYFVGYLTSQQVMMVMGMGPVPTYNPPYVPVGAVVNGFVIPSPGHLAA